MIRSVFFMHLLPFVFAAFCGIAAYYYYAPIDVPAPQTGSVGKNFKHMRGSGSSGRTVGTGPGQLDSAPPASEGNVERLRIISKPQARYTEAARQNQTEGSVRLKVTLLASGDIGAIVPVRELPDGLTEQAIEAARRIKFEPKKVEGVPVSTTVTIDYTFTIY